MRIKLESVRSKKYDDNIERYGDDINTCYLCGKRTAGNLYVHYTTSDQLTDEQEPEDSQGIFPIGLECAKKLPKNFILK